MAGRFVRASKYRHVFGKPTRKEFCYDNLHISRNAWDTNLIKVNPEYVAVNWEASGGGAFAVIPQRERGKLPDQIPLFLGHTATVLDTDWNPFNDSVIVSGSEDGKVFVWRVPDGFTLYSDAEEPPHVSPVEKLSGHTRKVGQVLFNPAAENILASASGDLMVRIWDVATGASPLTLRHSDIVQSLSWSADGTMLATTSRDKKIRVWDTRQQAPVHEHPGHSGAKNSRVVWMGEHNRIATTGFSRMSERQLALWEPGRQDPIGGFTMLDSISGVLMPFWDDGSNCLYLAGKGDGNIRYFEYAQDKFEFLSEYKSGEPQRGIAFLPRRGVNLHENEVMRAYKTVNDTYIEPISFTVPRRAETFQSDIYPPAIGLKPAVSAQEWFDGKSAIPPKIDLESVYEGGTLVELPSDYTPPVAVAMAPPAPAPAVVPVPAAVEPAKPPPRSPPTMSEQQASMYNMASKFKDEEDEDEKDEKEEEEDAHKSEQSRFDASPQPVLSRTIAPETSSRTTSKPALNTTAAAPVTTTAPSRTSSTTTSTTIPTTTTAAPTAATAAPTASPTPPPPPQPPMPTPVQTSLDEIKSLIETQTRTIATQTDRITALAGEVETLKRKVGAGSQDQSERIRQLELELEAVRT